METIPGSGNWRLTIRRETAGITLLRAATCDKRAVLPETLYGLPVTATWWRSSSCRTIPGSWAPSSTRSSRAGPTGLIPCSMDS